MDFFNILTSPDLLEMTEACLPEHRERLYPLTVTLSMFMKQALSADRSCQRSELDLFRGLLDTLRAGDVLLADALYCSIEDLCFHDGRHEGTSRLFERGYQIHEVPQFTLPRVVE